MACILPLFSRMSILNRQEFILTFIVLVFVLHIVSFYLIIPVGWGADQRVSYIRKITETGSLGILKNYPDEPTYINYPVTWLIASSINSLTSLGPAGSLLIVYLTAYACSILFLWLIIRMIIPNEDFRCLPYLIIIIIAISVYFTRPFLDLLPGGMGILAVLTSLYLFLKWGRSMIFLIIPLMLIFSIYMAHGLSIYIIVSVLIILALIYQLNGFWEKGRHAFVYALIIFGGTWAYQLECALFDRFIISLQSRTEQILKAVSTLFERSLTSEVQSQQIHFMKPFDVIVTLTAYGYLFCLTIAGLFYLLFKFIKIKDTSIMFPLTVGSISVPMFTIGLLFAYKGIENAIARYLYIYATPFAMISVIVFVYKLISDKKRLATFLLIITFIAGLLSITESFYLPYASIISVPDSEKYQQLYYNYYGKQIYIQRYPTCRIYSSNEVIRNNQSIVYNNGQIIATFD